MNSRIPARPISTPSPLVGSSLDEGTFSERGLLERNSGSGILRSSQPTPSKSRHEGEIEKVKVYARIRPALRDDETPGALVWSEDNGQLTIFRPEAPVPQSDFVFEKVLGPVASQADVYSAAVSDVVADVLRGYNGTILAYGQTGAGKTYTLGNTAPDAIGMIPRAAAEIFSAAARDAVHTYRITMSYIQIYMEMIQDLLNPTADNLPIREDAGGVFVAGACEVQVTCLEECLHYLELGEQNRVFAFTHLNAHSSRSHAVVMLTAVKSRKYLTNEERAQAEAPDQDGVVTQKVTVGKLYMVDLAGSERLKKSKSVGLRATEARSINLSLTMLGMCISARAQDSQHVPFRDSKLTRLLQESLGGNAKTSLILCLSDVRQHADESLQSLQFGSRASRVCNKPVVNERLQMRQLTAELLAALEEGNERTNGLEQALTQTKEERDALQAALARERARSAAIVDALRTEARAKDEQAAAKLAEQAELISEHVQQLGQVQQQQGQLEMEVAKLRAEQRAREEVHKSEVAELQQRLSVLQAAAAAERRALEAEARSQQVRLAAAAQQQAAVLTSQLAQERAAAREQCASIHLALTRLQRALGELVSAPLPLEEGGGGGGGGGYCVRRSSTEGAMESGGESGSSGRLLHRPSWVRAGLAAAAAAANRRGASSGGDGGGGGVSSGGSSSAVQMIQAALGLTGAAEDGEGNGDGNGGPSAAASGVGDLDGSGTGPTAAAIAVLVGGGSSNLVHAGQQRRHSHSMGAVFGGSGSGSGPNSGLLRDPQSAESGESGTGGSLVAALAAYTRGSQSRRATTSGSSLPPAGPSPQNTQPQYQDHNHQQNQQRSSIGSSGRSPSPSIQLHSSEIADIDAALAAAQQDLIADLRATVAVSGSVQPSNHHSLSGQGHGHGLGSASAGASGNSSAWHSSSPHSGGGGNYAAEYIAVRPPRSQIHGGGSNDGTGGPNGAVRNEASCGSGTLPYFLNGGLHSARGSVNGSSINPTAAAHLSSSPFKNESGHQTTIAAASAVSTVRYSSAGSGDGGAGGTIIVDVDADAPLRRGSGVVSVNATFDIGDSEGLKSEDMLAAMSAAGLSFTSLTAAAAAAAGTGMGASGGASYGSADRDPVPPLASSRSWEGGSSDVAGGGFLAPAPTLAEPSPSLPIFTGIQVQLDALMDIAAVLKRLKSSLEARVIAQACELARRQEEQQQSRSDVQAARAALNSAESHLACITQELHAVRMVLTETVDELGRTQHLLDDRSTDLDETRCKLADMAGLYDSSLMRLGETRGRLDEALGQLAHRDQALERLFSELEVTKADLVSERTALARALAASARSIAVTTQALTARHELQRQVRAANTIKAAYKRYKLAQLRSQVAVKHQALRDAETYRREREALQAARAGQALVQESVGAVRDAVGSILAAFVGRRCQLEARKLLQNRVERMMSQGGGSDNGKTGTACKQLPAGGGFPPNSGRPVSVGGASSTGGTGGGRGSGGGISGGSRSAGGGYAPPPLTPGAGRRHLLSPIGLSLMLSAVTMPPLTPTLASTTVASTSHIESSYIGGGGGGVTSGQRQLQRNVPSALLQLPDDTAVSASSGTPMKAVGGSSLGGFSIARSSGGGARRTGGGAVSAVGGFVGGTSGGGDIVASSTARAANGSVGTPAVAATVPISRGGTCSSSSSCNGAVAASVSLHTDATSSATATVIVAPAMAEVLPLGN